MSDSDVIPTIQTVGTVIVGIAIVVVLMGFIAPWLLSLIGGSAAWAPTVGSAEKVSNAEDRPSGLVVKPSAGYGVQLDTHEAHVDAPAEVPPGNWTVCTAAALDDTANQQATIDIVAIQNESITIRWVDGAWRGRFAPESAAAEVTASSDPTTMTPVCAAWNGTHLVVETPDGLDTAASGDDLPRRVSVGLVGTIDETRVVNRSFSQSERATYLDDPVNPVGKDDHELRLMFNEGEGRSVTAYYTSGDASLVGSVTWVSGVDVPTLSEGVDYAVDTDPLEITPLAGGYLDGAPYVQAEWSSSGFGGLASTLFNIGRAALMILTIGVFVLSARVVLDEFGGGGF